MGDAALLAEFAASAAFFHALLEGLARLAGGEDPGVAELLAAGVVAELPAVEAALTPRGLGRLIWICDHSSAQMLTRSGKVHCGRAVWLKMSRGRIDTDEMYN